MSLERTLQNLIRLGKLKKQNTDTAYINGLLEAAHRNFEAALMVQGKVDEAAFKLTYDGLLQVGRAILLLNGYRPDDGDQHKTTFEVAGIILGDEYRDLISRIQRFRVKRNNCMYNPIGLLSASETESIVSIGRQFWKQTKEYLREKDLQLHLFDF